MGDVKFANWRARKIIKEIDGLADICIPENQEDKRNEWKHTVSLYRNTIESLQFRNQFNDAAIDEFQNKADDFFSAWLSLQGYDGITNYIHMLGSGHIRYYLRKWGNLWTLQNQGWEQYNARVQMYWHHRTPKGGGKRSRSKLLPVARWILRLMLWKTGEGERFFKDLNDRNNEYDNVVDDESDDYVI